MNNEAVGVEIKDLVKTFPAFDNKNQEIYAANHVTLSVQPGELVTLLGPSGCGKTTLLRMVAGFLMPSSGEIYIGNREVSRIPPNKRNVGMMFQSYALFPHLSVYENVAYGLKLKHMNKHEISERVRNILQLMQIEEYASRFPNEISGGQQQRVALARAVVTEPSVLLFDEPLSNLDAKLREYMREELRKIQKRVGITSLYVTHDQSEAMAISDKVIIMQKGTIEQAGTAREIYARPKNKFVAGFIGKANFIKPDEVHSVSNGRAEITLLGKRMEIAASDLCVAGEPCTCMIRPEDIKINPEGHFKAKIISKAYFGQYIQHFMDLGGQEAEQMDFTQTNAGLHEGDEIAVDFVTESLRLLPDDKLQEA
ncbi:MAG: ABC transporter ATP-binding protein [Clostridia bacterium]|nr:ABC transporter ATP-binding protein [Clostridia bacterium]